MSNNIDLQGHSGLKQQNLCDGWLYKENKWKEVL